MKELPCGVSFWVKFPFALGAAQAKESCEHQLSYEGSLAILLQFHSLETSCLPQLLHYNVIILTE